MVSHFEHVRLIPIAVDTVIFLEQVRFLMKEYMEFSQSLSMNDVTDQ